MSTETPTQTARALDDLRYRAGDLTPTERFVFLTIAAQHDDRGANATHPHFVSEVTGIPRGKVDKIVAALLDTGYIFPVEGFINVYEVVACVSALPYTRKQVQDVLIRISESAGEIERFVIEAEQYCWHDTEVDSGPSFDAIERDVKVVKDMIHSNMRHEALTEPPTEDEVQAVLAEVPEPQRSFLQGVIEGYQR